jgi:hypothetical protein
MNGSAMLRVKEGHFNSVVENELNEGIGSISTTRSP